MPTVLHVLPHPGGGAETYVDLLERHDAYRHLRVSLSASRSRWLAAASLPIRWPQLPVKARAADLVHVHGDTAAILAMPLLDARPTVITTHGLHRVRRVRGPGARFARARMARAIERAAVTICTSQAERDELAAFLAAEAHGRLVVVANGVEPRPAFTSAERERARAALGIPDAELVALFAGQLEPRKEPLVAVAAANRAREAGLPIVLLVAGDGPLRRAVSARAGASVRVLGFRADLDPLYAAADVFVLPSRREGMSMALLEAMARGLPAVVANAPGNAEAVGRAGLVVEPGAAALAAGIEAATDAGLRERLGAAARARIEHELNAERFAAETHSVYERVLGKAPRGPR